MRSLPRYQLIGLALVLGGTFIFKLTRPHLLMPSRQRLQQAFPGESRSVLEHAAHWTLFSLDPSPVFIVRGGFHGYRILGQLV